jgi:hypothetical protein
MDDMHLGSGRAQAQKFFFGTKQIKKCAYIMGGYNYPLHALIIWGLVFFLGFAGLASVSGRKKEAKKKRFFLILSL